MPKRSEIDPEMKTSGVPVRTTMQVAGRNFYRIYAFTKNYGLSIGDVLEVMLEVTGTPDMQAKLEKAMEEKRRDKVIGRASRRGLATMLADASSQQMALVQQIVAAGSKK